MRSGVGHRRFHPASWRRFDASDVRHRRRWRRWALVLAAASLWMGIARPAFAVVVYEWLEPSGVVVYSQWPPHPGEGVLLRTLTLADVPAAQRSTLARIAAAGAAGDEPRRAWERADARVAAALERLRAAERALRAGQEPLPGERRHLVNGHSRLTRAYFDRIAALEAAVARARAELRAAYSARDALSGS